MADFTVRPAWSDDLVGVMGVLDAASLVVKADAVAARIAAGSVLVATADGPVLGACVLVENEIDAIAVRRSRRGQGIGTRLVEAAADRTDGPLVAEFHPRVRAFYDALGFAVEPTADPDRFRGKYD